MSLEAAIEANTAALTKHSELLEQVIAAGKARTESTGAAASGDKSVAGRPPGSKNKDKTGDAKTDAKKDAPKADKLTEAQESELRDTISAFVGKDDDKEARAKRAGVVKEVFKKYSIAKAGEVSPGDYDAFLADIKAAIEGASGDEGDEELM